MRLVDPIMEDLFLVGKRYSLRELAADVDSVSQAIQRVMSSIDPTPEP